MKKKINNFYFFLFILDNGEDSSPVLCLITRPDEVLPIETNLQQQTNKQFVIKFDTQGRTIRFDTSDLRDITYRKTLTKDNCKSIDDITHIQDLHKLKAHLKEVLQNPNGAQSVPYRMRLGGPDVYVHVTAHSKLFATSKEGESDFIMSSCTILNESELAALEAHNNNNNTISNNNNNNNINNNNNSNNINNNSLSLPSTSQVTSYHTNMGGPLMTSVINGTVPHVQSSKTNSNSMITSYSSPPAPDNIFPNDSYDFPFDMNVMESVGFALDSRPDSRTSVTPGSTPRPPSVPAYSPMSGVCPSPLTTHHAGQPSPSNNNNNNILNNNNLTSNHNNNNNNIISNNNINTSVGYGNYSFANFDDKDSRDQTLPHMQHQMPHSHPHPQNQHLHQQQLHQQQQQQLHLQQQQNIHSGRLRNLLTKPPSLNAGMSGGDNESDPRGPNKILKGLLNSDEEKDNNGTFNKMNNNLNASRLPAQRQGANANNMLLQLLNEKSDDDDNSESRSNQKNSSELLRQLQKDETPKEHNNPNIDNEQLIHMLRFQGNDCRKRPNSETEDGPLAKRSEDKPSKLREKNKMLASLLSNPSKAPTTFTAPTVKMIPDIIQSRIPTSGLAQPPPPPPPTQPPKTQQQMVNMQQQMHPTRAPSQQQQQQQQQLRKTSDLYLNQQMPSQQELNKNYPVCMIQINILQYVLTTKLTVFFYQIMQPSSLRYPDYQFDTGSYATAAAVTPLNCQTGSEEELEKILNGIIEIEPELSTSIATNTAPNSDYNEKYMINAITKSLMQVESTAGFNNSPPAYSMHNINTQSNSQVNSFIDFLVFIR